MSFTTIKFILFVISVCVLYFLTPKRYRWVSLLVSSYVFYLFAGAKMVFFLLFSTLTSYFAARAMDRIAKHYVRTDIGASREERRAAKQKAKSRKKIVLVLVLVFNFGILALLKYFNDFAGILNDLIGIFDETVSIKSVSFILPLGISFYTFQSMGYLIDVFRGKYEAEKNPARFALFVSFFPQLVQGPISRYDDLAKQLFEPHRFDYIRAKHGVELMLFGYFKKLVIADRIAVFVNSVFDNYTEFNGFYILIAGVLYCIQIYTDFSGGMDIALGVAKILGIDLPDNFARPYFARTLPDYWRRWHITLNRWLRDYIFYPISLSKSFVKLSKAGRKGLKSRFGRNFAIYLATLLVRIINAIWHGGDAKYFINGFYHGILIILGLQLKPLTDLLTVKLKVRTECFSWRLFQTLRTFSLVMLGRILLHATDLKEGIDIIKHIFMEFNPWIFFDGSLYKLGLTKNAFWVMIASVFLLFFFSVLSEKGVRIRETLERQNIVFQWIVLIVCIYSILIFGMYGPGYLATEFIYQQF